MRFAITLIILLLGLIKYQKSRSLLAIDTIFHLYWAVICFLSVIRLYGLHEADIQVYYIVLVGNVGFFMGTIAPQFVLKRTKTDPEQSTEQDFILRYDIVKIVLTIGALVLIIQKIILMMPAISRVGVQGARGLMQLDESLNLQGFEGVLFTYYGRPFIRALSIVMLVNMMKTKIVKVKVILVIFLNLLIYFSDGGRSAIVLLFWALVYLFFTGEKKISLKMKKQIIWAGALMLAIGILSTIERKSAVIRGLYIYYAAPLAYLTKQLVKPSVFGERLYGFASFQGILNPFFGVLNYLGISDPVMLNKANQFIYDIQLSNLPVADNDYMNYFVTCFGYFYRDGGFLGVLIIGAITGYVVKHFMIKSKRCNNLRYVSLATLFFQGIMFTMSKYLFSDYNFVMTIVFIYVITTDFIGSSKKKNGI